MRGFPERRPGAEGAKAVPFQETPCYSYRNSPDSHLSFRTWLMQFQLVTSGLDLQLGLRLNNGCQVAGTWEETGLARSIA